MKESFGKLVSIIMPCYNGEEFLQETLDSVAAQTYPNVEIVFVDDGSADHSVEIARNYQGNIQIIQQKNYGVSTARNVAIAHAKGDYIMFLDADDILHPDAVKRRVKIIEANPEIGMVVGSVFSFSDCVPDFIQETSPLELKEGYNFYKSLRGLPPQASLYKKSVFLKSGFFDPFISLGEDTDFMIRCSRYFKMGADCKTSLYYRVRSSSSSKHIQKFFLNRKFILVKNSILDNKRFRYWWSGQLSYVNLVGYFFLRLSETGCGSIGSAMNVIKSCKFSPAIVYYLCLFALKSLVRTK